jgi:hypothetical protein
MKSVPFAVVNKYSLDLLAAGAPGASPLVVSQVMLANHVKEYGVAPCLTFTTNPVYSLFVSVGTPVRVSVVAPVSNRLK